MFALSIRNPTNAEESLMPLQVVGKQNMLVIALAPPGGTFEYEAGAPVMSNTQLLMSIEHIADRKMCEGPL